MTAREINISKYGGDQTKRRIDWKLPPEVVIRAVAAGRSAGGIELQRKGNKIVDL